MNTETLIVMPNVLAAVTGVNAITVAAHSVRVELNTPNVRTMRFARKQLDARLPDDAVALADISRVMAYRYGKPCQRNLTRA